MIKKIILVLCVLISFMNCAALSDLEKLSIMEAAVVWFNKQTPEEQVSAFKTYVVQWVMHTEEISDLKKRAQELETVLKKEQSRS